MGDLAYRITDLVKVYATHSAPAVDNISLDIRSGEIFGILGDNGAGKSTLVRQMVGLLRPSSGDIELFGKSVARDSEQVSRFVGYMPQNSLALNRLTVSEAIYFSAHLRGMSRREAMFERDEMIETWKLSSLRNRSSVHLSGGQRRLLQLAVATAGQCPVLVLDEPTNDLDPINRRHVWDVLHRLNADRGTTVIFITHDAIEAERIVQRVAIMMAGKFIAVGTPADLKSRIQQYVRLEVSLPESGGQLPTEAHWQWRPDGSAATSVHRDSVNAILNELISRNATADFRLYSATLEDLYVHLATTN
ncbi:ABC transporter ATP-binding protein [Nocardia sp. NPDC005978]|uniref:ABC transporter ATP-binding protein n=1 Tax=Nocardia sp. NPDC005978 TaxID=3156725 RepID=UPI0033B18405